MPTSQSQDASVADLQGEVITPDDAAYEEARRVFFKGFDRRPAAIVRPQAAEEVARAVNRAREGGLELAVRSGGHSRAGYGTTDGGIVIDLSGMNAIDIDADAKTVWVETGTKAGEFTTPRARPAWSPGWATPARSGSAASRSREASASWPARTGSPSTTCSPPRSSPPTARSSRRARSPSPTCSGRSAAARATSESRPV